MTSNEEVSRMSMDNSSRLSGIRAASGICLLAGIWFFVSPWVYGAYMSDNAWNSWIVGAAMFIIGCVRVSRPVYSGMLSWLNMLLGIWAFFSPWIYGYSGNTGRLINSLCVGVVVFVLSIVSARLAMRTTMAPVTHS